RPHQHHEKSQACRAKPLCLIVSGRDRKIQGCPNLVPDAIIIGGNYMKPIRSWAEIGIKSLASGSRFLPVSITAFQLVTKPDFWRDRKTQRRVVNLHITCAGGKMNLAL